MKTLLVLVALLAPAIADAAVVRCHTDPFNGMTICSSPDPAPTAQPPRIPTYAPPPDRAPSSTATTGDYKGEPGLIGLMGVLQQRARYKKVGKLVADGHCAEALQTATAAGDFDLAGQVRQLCSPSAAPTPPPTEPASIDEAIAPPATMDEAGVKMWVVRNIDVQDWLYAGFDDYGAYLYSAAGPVAMPDGAFQLWFKGEIFRPQPQHDRSRKLLYEGNCSNRTVRLVRLEGYAKHNLVGETGVQDIPDAKWETADGLQANLLNRFCAVYSPPAASAAH